MSEPLPAIKRTIEYEDKLWLHEGGGMSIFGIGPMHIATDDDLRAVLRAMTPERLAALLASLETT